jgi:ABC-type Fe3+ transport system substrate-binding protein
MSDLLVYATQSRAESTRTLLAAGCQATGSSARLELFGSGSLYQRLGPRHLPPPADIVFWFGPFAAHAAGLDGLLQPYQPPRTPEGAAHDPEWKWSTLEYSTIGLVGAPPVTNWTDLMAVPRLAIADPERSEVGLAILLASLDRSRQTEPDVEQGWTWWQRRAQVGLVLAEDEAGATALVDEGGASHALTLARAATPLVGLAPIPHAIALAASSRNVDAARRLLDWLTSEAAGAMLTLSPWQSATNGLASHLQAAPPLDLEWAGQQYSATRRRWAQSGFGPAIAGL